MSGVDHFHSAHCSLWSKKPVSCCCSDIIAVTVYPVFGPSSLILLNTDARIPSYNSGMGSFKKKKKTLSWLYISLIVLKYLQRPCMTWLAITTSILSPIICSFYLDHPGLLLTAPGSHQLCHQLKGLFITSLSSKIHLLYLVFHSHSIKNSTQIPNLYNHSFMLSESLSLVPNIYSLYCSYFCV